MGRLWGMSVGQPIDLHSPMISLLERSNPYQFGLLSENFIAFPWNQAEAIQYRSFYSIHGQISGFGWMQLYEDETISIKGYFTQFSLAF